MFEDGMVIKKNNKIYNKALFQEMKTWKRKSVKREPSFLFNKNKSFNTNNSEISKYYNSLLSIDSNSQWGWIEFITNNYQPCHSALSLGSGSGTVEQTFIQSNFVKKFDTIDIIDSSKNKTLEINDLNFINLPDNTYDFILCKGILHHIINLEHLLYQINKALTPNGILVVKEYVGEPKALYRDQRLDYINCKIKEKFGDSLNNFELFRQPYVNGSPFGGVRSNKIPILLDYYFKEQIFLNLRYGGVTFPLITTLNMLSRYKPFIIEQNMEIMNNVISYSIDLDRECIKSNDVKPCLLLGVYGKSSDKIIPSVEEWSDKLINFHFKSRRPLHRKFKIKVADMYHNIKSKI